MRPDWRTVERHPLLRPAALAARDGTCECGAEVLENEPIVCVGAALERREDGSTTVNLSGTSWRCQRPHPGL